MRWVMLVLVAAATVVAVPNMHVALERSRQKRSMAEIRDVADRIEKGAHAGTPEDGWGRPLRILRSGSHYSVRSSGADGIFEMGPNQGPVDGFERDIVLIDGTFRQTPNGI